MKQFKIIHYYEKITTHDSSLSSCILVAMKINEVEKDIILMESAS